MWSWQQAYTAVVVKDKNDTSISIQQDKIDFTCVLNKYLVGCEYFVTFCPYYDNEFNDGVGRKFPPWFVFNA